MQTIASLGKLCALCEDVEDPMEVAEFTEVLKLVELQENIEPRVRNVSSIAEPSHGLFPSALQQVNPNNRPMRVEEVISAYVQEGDCNGFAKALLLVSSLTASPVSPVSQAEARRHVQRVYEHALASDDWAEFGERPEQFEVQAACSNVASLIHRVHEFSE